MPLIWERFWFDDEDPRRPALLRIGWSLAMLWAVGGLFPDLEWLFTSSSPFPGAGSGFLPLNLLSNGVWELTTPGQVQAVWALLMAALGLSLVGLGGRAPVLVAWVLFVSLCNRCPAMAFGSHAILRVFGVYLMLMPVSATWSLDAKWRGERADAPRWPVQLWRLNVCLLYLVTTVSKLWFEDWRIGDAVSYTLAPGALSRFDLEPLLTWPGFPWLGRLLTWGTLAFEGLFFLVWHPRFRRVVLLSGVALHLGISLTTTVGHFTTSVLMTYLAFVELPRPLQ